jgi:hypothetical protein
MFPKVEGRLFSLCWLPQKLNLLLAVTCPEVGLRRRWPDFLTEYDELERYLAHVFAVRA